MRFASCMAPNSESFFIESARFVASKLGVEAIIAHDADWETRERELDRGAIQVGWICGLPYVWKADLPNPPVTLLAAPVMQAERYGDRAVYFSDVLVRADSPVQTFSELRGARWAFNEPRSHSGCNVVKAHLFDLGEREGFFESLHIAGSHENAIEMVQEGYVDAAAIDTTVFDTAVLKNEELRSSLRPIETLGPSPMPPWVVSTKVKPGHRRRMQEILTHMHEDTEGRQILIRHRVSRYAPVADEQYDPIRVMDRKARQVQLCSGPPE